ncbi:MAG: biotin--[acetyl-CoA-carboxylase] ligase, partial [Paramuribaculum sp.]|nr:biotin--[acetyl-CoA-carboxylase] ligase [Paramuribaculum sp.]
MDLIKVEETESTNSLAVRLLSEYSAPFGVMAYRQTAGRGQRGNSWESAPGANVTMSVVCCPDTVRAADQFIISQAISVSIVDVLCHYLPDHVADIAVKWPNDIYVGDNKICGILIENSLNGNSIVRSVVGVGLNVNQTEFVSDAPNPVSMKQLSGCGFNVDDVAGRIGETFLRVFDSARSSDGSAKLRDRYFSMLWRSDGYYPYVETATGHRFEAMISDIGRSGLL